MDLIEVIQTRRSSRSFRNMPVAEEIIQEMLHAAQAAPSGGNGQNHLFGVVDDANLKDALAQSAGGQMWIAQAPIVIACCARLEPDLRELPEEDFGLIVNQTRFGRSFIDYLNLYENRRIVRTLFSNAAPLIPAEHMFLTAVSHGLSACFVGYLDVEEASRILQLPEDMACLFLLPVGYAEKEPGEKNLKSLEEISFRNRFA